MSKIVMPNLEALPVGGWHLRPVGVAKKSEHFRRWLHFMRYCVLHGYSYVHLCKTHEMLANALTKVENKHAYLHFAKVFYNIRA